jgi:hypothetical protein
VSSSSWITSTSTWWRSLSSFFLTNFQISFVTISIWMSLWRSASLIYQGASTMFLSTLFWIRWMLTVLLCFVLSSPQLYAVGPHRLQYLFVQHQIIVYRQGRSSSHEPIHFLVFWSKLFAFFNGRCIKCECGATVQCYWPKKIKYFLKNLSEGHFRTGFSPSTSVVTYLYYTTIALQIN